MFVARTSVTSAMCGAGHGLHLLQVPFLDFPQGSGHGPVLLPSESLQQDLFSVGGDHQGGACMPWHLGVCDVTLVKLGSGRPSGAYMVPLQVGGSGYDASNAELLHSIHHAECGSLTTERYQVTADVSITLSGVGHAFQFLDDLVVYLLKVPQFGFTHGEVLQACVLIDIRKKTANTAHRRLGVSVGFHDCIPLLEVLSVLFYVVRIFGVWYSLFCVETAPRLVFILSWSSQRRLWRNCTRPRI